MSPSVRSEHAQAPSRAARPQLGVPFTAEPGPARQVRVASVPAGHVYVRHCGSAEGTDGVTRLADPRPNGAPSTSQRWWPPVMLDPEWVKAHHDEFDLYHLHFGFDAQSPRQLSDLVSTLRRYGKPFVYTVHDLRNPHQPDPAAHDAALDVLVPAADRLITLTPGAAAQIERRWGRAASVVAHPHVVEPAELARPRPAHEGFVVGLHAKSLRPNMTVLPAVRALTDCVAALPGARLHVNVHREVADPAAHAYDPEAVRALRDWEARGMLRLRVHDYFDDGQLWDYLSGLDLSVLPYAFGTHSGWLEACHDLGTAVAAPRCGFYAEQRPCLSFDNDDRAGLDEDTLRAAVVEAYESRPVWRATVEGRAEERSAVAAAHGALYRELLA